VQSLLSCPECKSEKIYRDGLRYLSDGSSVQRFLCRSCGYRFSENQNHKNPSCDSSLRRQICASSSRKKSAKNLSYKTEPQGERLCAEATEKADVKGKILEYGFWQKKQGYRESTAKTRMMHLEILVRRGSNLHDPESVKKTLALQEKWCEATKSNYVDSYTCFVLMEGLTWNPPKYKRISKYPFVPSEAELDVLIASSGKTLSLFLSCLKETAIDPGELEGLSWIDVNKEAKTITINKPVKGHNSRILQVSTELIKRLETLPKNNSRIFDVFTLRRNFYYRRKATARKFQNPRILQIHFTTFRHWKATHEYHRTKDVLYVQKLLGHKNIQNTLIYIDLEKNLFHNADDEGYTSRIATNVGEACNLIDSGFEYVTGNYDDGGKIFRKRKTGEFRHVQ